MERTPLTPRPLVYAHRGDRSRAPDNTIEAFDLAIEAGADGIELDVRRTSDHTLIVSHDPSIGDLPPFESIAFADLRSARPEVPTLEEVLEHVPRRIFLNVEVKHDPRDDGFDEDRGVAVQTVDLIQRIDDPDRVLLSSFDISSVERFGERAPGMLRGQLVAGGMEFASAVSLASQINTDAVHPPMEMIEEYTETQVRAAHDYGLAVVVWNANSPEQGGVGGSRGSRRRHHRRPGDGTPSGRSALNRHDRVGCDPLTGPDEPEPISGLPLHRDLVQGDMQRLCDLVTHLIPMGCDPHVLHEDHDIDVLDLEAPIVHLDEARPEHVHRPRTLGRWIVARELHAEVAEGDSTEERVGDGVGCDIPVRCRHDALIVGDLDAAEHDRAVTAETMCVVPEAGANNHHEPTSLLRASSRARSRSSGYVTLRFIGSPSTIATVPPACSTIEASSVTSRVSNLAVHPLEHLVGESLWGLNGHEHRPVERLLDEPS